MMTHIFENDQKKRIIAAKGAPEATINVSTLTEEDKYKMLSVVKKFGQQGYRVLGVARARFDGNEFPEKQQDLRFDFLGLTIFYDPPKKEIKNVLKRIYEINTIAPIMLTQMAIPYIKKQKGIRI